MKQKVVRHDRCEMCGNVQETIIRDEHINRLLNDADILRIIYKESKHGHARCDKCNMLTLQTAVAWDIEDKEEGENE